MACDRWRVAGATTLAIALLGSLVCNYRPAITAVLLVVATVAACVAMVRGRAVPRAGLLLVLPFGCWALSFLATRESWGVFFSPEFLRRDGAIYASMLPIAALAVLPIDRDRIRSAILIYFAVQAAIAVAGGFSALGGWISPIYTHAIVVDSKLTFFGLYVTHNATASVYLLLALGAFTWALHPESAGRFRAALLVLAVLLALGCILARSRGAFLALGAGVVFASVRAMRRGVSRRALTVAVGGVTVAVLAGGILLFPRFTRMTESGTDNFRRVLWTRAWEDFKTSPVIGVGFGRYNDTERQFESVGIGRVATRAVVVNDDRHAHNSYLHFLAEGGAIGSAVMIVYWILVTAGVKGDDPWRDWILVGIVALAVLSLTEHYAGGGIYLTHLAFLIGVRQSGVRSRGSPADQSGGGGQL